MTMVFRTSLFAAVVFTVALPTPASRAEDVAEAAHARLHGQSGDARSARPAAVPDETGPLRDHLMRRFGAESGAVGFYEMRGFAPFWLDRPGAAEALLAALDAAPDHALPGDYGAETLAAHLAAAPDGPAAQAVLEVEMTAAFLEFASDLGTGVLEPRRVDRELHVYPEGPTPEALLLGAEGASDVARYLAELAPQDPSYAVLLENYARFRAKDDAVWGPPVPAGRTLRRGDRNARVGDLRRRLTLMGDLKPMPASAGAPETSLVAANAVTTDAGDLGALGATDDWVFDAALEAAVRHFQTRHGLNADGLVGPATLAALNVQPDVRAKQIAVTLERMRWLNRDLGRRHVFVNLAGYEMALVEDGRPIFTSRVVIGRDRHRTPEFSDEMEHMVVNPTWYVPYSIASQEILPRIKADPGYLARKNMTLHGADVWSVDWSQVTARTFPGRITQGPGAGNALGRVKFMFPNDLAIYLHDTPAKSLFSRDMRAHSHGCVRVEKPYELAAQLLAPQEADPQRTFDRWLRNGRERYVHFDTHVPVHITYRTAWVNAAGELEFRGDVYGRDRKIARALADAGVAVPAL